jgi:predicted TIM-barrel fold metal-dependent hydrolase
VFTHCSNSQGAFAGAALRAAPNYWKTVLDRPDLNKLRVNLAHAGGPWCFATPDAKNCIDPITRQRLHWFEQTVELIATRKYPNLYLDIADFDIYMACEAQVQLDAVLAGFKSVLGGLSANARTFVMDRMIYGTDWILLGRSPFAEYYFERMYDLLVKPLADAFNDPGFKVRFYRENPLRFLGLLPTTETPTPSTRARLEKFYDERCGRKGMLAAMKL